MSKELATATTLCMVGALTVCSFVSDSAEADEAAIQQSMNLVVMLKGRWPDDTPSFGAAIIFGQDDDALYLATANHVVRRGSTEAIDLTATFLWAPQEQRATSLATEFDAALDLAVLRVDRQGDDSQASCLMPFDRLSGATDLARGAEVFPVGQPVGAPWGMPVVPDRVAQVIGNDITFQSAFISAGHSGGALLNTNGDVVGLIRADQPPFGVAITLTQVVAKLAGWGKPVQLHAPGDLNAAVSSGSEPLVEQLINACADLELHVGGKSPLDIATENGYHDIFAMLVAAGAKSAGTRSLSLAARTGNTQAFDALLPSSTAADRAGALSEAVVGGQRKIALQLIDAGAPINESVIRDAMTNGQLWLLEAALASDVELNLKLLIHDAAGLSDDAFIRALLAHGADPNAEVFRDTVLDVAVASGSVETVEALVEAGADLTPPRPLLLAIEHDRESILELLLSAGAEPNGSRRATYRPLAYAVIQGRHSMVQTLLDAGADPNVSSYGGLPLHSAARRGDVAAVEALLEAGAIPGPVESGDRSSLHAAASGGNVAVAKLLIERGVDVNTPHHDGPPLFVAVRGGHVDMARLLLESGARPDEGDYFTPITYATVRLDDPSMVQVLLDHGADPNLVDEHSYVALTGAIWKQNISMVKLLLDNGADPNGGDSGHRILVGAADRNESQIVRLLLDAGAVPDGTEALEEAADDGDVTVVTWLLDAGAKQCNGDVLSAAIDSRVPEVLKLLLEHDCDPNSVTRALNTPLYIAVDSEKPEMVRLLLEHGADPERIPDYQYGSGSPLARAVLLENREIQALLRSHGAKQ